MYIDHFLVVANSRAECQHIADELVSLLRHLGFRISWKKFTQCITFLGVEIDYVDMCFRVPDCKLTATIGHCQTEKGYQTSTRVIGRQIKLDGNFNPRRTSISPWHINSYYTSLVFFSYVYIPYYYYWAWSPELCRPSNKLRVLAQPYTGLFVLFDRVINGGFDLLNPV